MNKKRINILLISRNSPFSSIGGIERYITNLIAHYKTHTESKLFIMLPTSTDEEDSTEEDGNVTIYYSKNLFLSRSVLATKKEISQKAQGFAKNVLKIIQKDKIDIICAENFHIDLTAYALLLSMVSMSLKIPLILQLHSFAVTELQTELINQLKWDKVSCISKSVAGDCFQKGTDIDLISTHYLGVNTEEFNVNFERSGNLKKQLKLSPDTKIILTATRILHGRKNTLQSKGIINLVEAFSRVSPKYPNLKLLIAIGKPPENLNKEFQVAFEMLQGYIKLHGVSENTILEFFKLQEMPDVYRGSDIFALPSENETFGQVFVEAMACGIPVIGTNVGGIPEIISDLHNGFLIPPNNSSILAQKIEELLNNTDLRENFVKAGIKTVSDVFTSEKQFFGFNKMLEETVLDI